MRICKTKSGKFLEAQSDATEGTLIANAVGGGYEAKNLVESVISDADFDKLMQDLVDQSLTYADKRKVEYDQMGNQFEMIFDDQDAWRNKINEIKAKYPKE
tara:strand:+ start:420 stop:722 length:303 start_codon:yes stop_codon:yes gene_type:complete